MSEAIFCSPHTRYSVPGYEEVGERERKEKGDLDIKGSPR